MAVLLQKFGQNRGSRAAYGVDYSKYSRINPSRGGGVLGSGSSTLTRNSDEYNYNGSTLDVLINDQVRIHSTKGAGFEPAVANLLPFKDFDSGWTVAANGDDYDIKSGGTAYWFQENKTNGAATTTLDSDSIRSAASARAVKVAISAQGDATSSVRFYSRAAGMPLYMTTGTTYTIGFWAKASTAKTVPISGAGGLSSSVNITTSYSEFEITWTSNATTTLGDIIWVLGQLGTFDFYIDAISFKEGSFADSRWIGGDAAVGADEVTDGVFEAVTETNAYTSDFSAGVDGWTASQGAAAGNIDGIGGQDDNLRFTVDGDSSTHRANKSTLFTVGKTSRIRLDYYIPSGQSNIDGIVLYSGLGGVAYSTNQTVTDAWANTDTYVTARENANFVIYATDGGNRTFQDAGADDVFYIRNVIIDDVTLTSWTDTADGLAPGTDGAGALNGKASWDGSQSAESALTQSGTAATAKTSYRLETVVTRSAGTVTVEYGSVDGTTRNASGTYYDYITALDTDFLKYKADSSFTGTVDTVVVKTHGSVGVSESAQLSYTLPTSPIGGALFAETLGAEIATGTLTLGLLYNITADTGGDFYAGSAVGEYFVSDGTETADGDSKVKNVTNAYDSGTGLLPPHATVMAWVRFGYAWDDAPVNGTHGAVAISNTAASLIWNRNLAGTSGAIRSFDGMTSINQTWNWPAGTLGKLVLKYGYLVDNVLKFGIAIDTGSGIGAFGEATYDGAYTTGTDLILAHTPFGPIWIQKWEIYPSILSDEKINALGSP